MQGKQAKFRWYSCHENEQNSGDIQTKKTSWIQVIFRPRNRAEFSWLTCNFFQLKHQAAITKLPTTKGKGFGQSILSVRPNNATQRRFRKRKGLFEAFIVGESINGTNENPLLGKPALCSIIRAHWPNTLSKLAQNRDLTHCDRPGQQLWYFLIRAKKSFFGETHR